MTWLCIVTYPLVIPREPSTKGSHNSARGLIIVATMERTSECENSTALHIPSAPLHLLQTRAYLRIPQIYSTRCTRVDGWEPLCKVMTCWLWLSCLDTGSLVLPIFVGSYWSELSRSGEGAVAHNNNMCVLINTHSELLSFVQHFYCLSSLITNRETLHHFNL